MSPLILTTYNTPDSLAKAAQDLLQHAGQQRVWCLEGPLGAGKTTLIRALCTQLGVQDNVSSPTFARIHQYATITGTSVYHCDFYRLHRQEEALDLDCMAYFDSGYYCFVEWPSKIPQLLPSTYYHIALAFTSPECRQIQAQFHSS